VPFSLAVPTQFPLALQRKVDRFPYVPADRATLDERCMEVYNIQVNALLQRLNAVGGKKLVIGISGGLDSTHALLVCAAAMDRAGAAAQQHPRLHDARLRDDDAHARPGQAA
jgi:NAD+ synthase (glutamine-hydrolysing)